MGVVEQAFYALLLCITCKRGGGGGGQTACNIAYVINGRLCDNCLFTYLTR